MNITNLQLLSNFVCVILEDGEARADFSSNTDYKTFAETYDVDSLSDIPWGIPDMAQPFPGLILDEEKQNLIKANCRSAESRQRSPDLSADRIGGKGEGSVIMLHGSILCQPRFMIYPILSLMGGRATWGRQNLHRS